MTFFGPLNGQEFSKELLNPGQLNGSRFKLLAPADTGVDFHSPLLVDHDRSYLYHSGFATGGVCIGDLNGDDKLDLFFASGPSSNRLFLQGTGGSLHFQEISNAAGADGGTAWGAGSAFVDIDNDGDLDIYVCNYDSPNQLFINHSDSAGNLRFEESAQTYGLDVVDASLMPAFADYDLDGDLDLYILNNQYYRPGGRPRQPPFKMLNGKPTVLPEFQKYYQIKESAPGSFSMDSYGRPDRLFRNNGKNSSGDITYTEVSSKAGVHQSGHGLSVTWWDYNNDLFPDIYIGNDFTEPDRLYRNNQDGTFTDVIRDTLPYCSWSSMGASAADFNNDGLLDFFSADMAATTHFEQKINMGDMSKHRYLMEHGWPRQVMRNMLYVNSGADVFMETAWMSGVAQSNWTWAVKAADFDSDGLADLFLSNGMVRNFSDADIPINTGMLQGQNIWDIYKDTPSLPQQNLAFRNHGNLQFKPAGDWGFDQKSISYGAAYGDLDSDGDLDLVVVNLGGLVSIYQNELSQGNQVVLRLRGTQSNHRGIGSHVTFRAGDQTQTAYLNPMSGFLSCNSDELHFGIGNRGAIQNLEIEWPSGRRQIISSLDAGYRYTITESEEPSAALSSTPPEPTPVFAEEGQSFGLTFEHRERPFDDYKRQPLLPAKLSQQGPGMAWGDANEDGRDELYVGGAAGQPGALYTRGASNRFKLIPGPWRDDAESEDMGCLWFDVDIDGDLDLYVGSGGVEHPVGSPYLLDRLYLNQGDLNFVKASPDRLPHGAHSTSAVVGADIDQDNDIDLFIGVRSIPGKFPLSPQSYLLLNESKPGEPRFVDVSVQRAPGLAGIGMVTGAMWSDANQDGKPDLLVTTEWGSIKFFENQGGRFLDQSEALGLAQRTGWWNSITGADLDADGDIDYIAMNVGVNTKYGKASPEKPASLYYGDMDGTGQPHLVEAKLGNGDALPIRGLSCSTAAMPHLGKKFPSFRAFASADLLDIYTPKKLIAAHNFEANTFESGILINESSSGVTRFSWLPLPWIAQVTPGYGVVAADVDGDRQQDLVFVGNNDTREPETGLWRGAPGMFLKGIDPLNWSQLSAAKSGLVAPSDTKSFTMTDLDGDGSPDLVAVENNGSILAFRNQSRASRFLTVRLQGPSGNLAALGAVIQLRWADGTFSMAEIQGGSGYLSQSTATAFFSLGATRPQSLSIQWPDGTKQIRSLANLKTQALTIQYESN